MNAADRSRRPVTSILIALPIILLCIALGGWQIQRLHWKEGLIAQRDQALRAPPVSAPDSLAAARALDLHRVTAGGVFSNDKEILLHAIAPGGAAGFDVLTPLRAPNGRHIFINRGFVPSKFADPRSRIAGQPAGSITVVGLLRLPPASKPGWFLPDNRPTPREWFWIDLPAMAKADGLSGVAPFYIDADATPNPGGWPRGGTTLPDLPNNHLQYALTWFSLAIAAAIIFYRAWRLSDAARAAIPDRTSPR